MPRNRHNTLTHELQNAIAYNDCLKLGMEEEKRYMNVFFSFSFKNETHKNNKNNRNKQIGILKALINYMDVFWTHNWKHKCHACSTGNHWIAYIHVKNVWDRQMVIKIAFIFNRRFQITWRAFMNLQCQESRFNFWLLIFVFSFSRNDSDCDFFLFPSSVYSAKLL